jgi:hypothetical protein
MTVGNRRPAQLPQRQSDQVQRDDQLSARRRRANPVGQLRQGRDDDLDRQRPKRDDPAQQDQPSLRRLGAPRRDDQASSGQ